jgi:hypothetical protein
MGDSAPDAARLTWDRTTQSYSRASVARDASCDRFIRGPLPLSWIMRAAALPGKAFHVSMGLWYVSGLCRSTTFPFKRSVADDFGVSVDAVYDALKNLERAGLISVVRHKGRCPIVTILGGSVNRRVTQGP